MVMDSKWRSNPELKFPEWTIELHELTREIYGNLWMTDEGFWTLDFLKQRFPNGGDGMIEVGSAYGASFHCWSTIFRAPRISVDIPDGAWGASSEMVKERLEKWHKYIDTDCYQVIGDSAHAQTVNKVKELLNGKLVDWLFIDANHDYEPAMSDYLNYKPFVKSGGYIGFHDIYHPAHINGCGKVWKEIQGEKWECNWHWTGVGIVKVE